MNRMTGNAHHGAVSGYRRTAVARRRANGADQPVLADEGRLDPGDAVREGTGRVVVVGLQPDRAQRETPEGGATQRKQSGVALAG